METGPEEEEKPAPTVADKLDSDIDTLPGLDQIELAHSPNKQLSNVIDVTQLLTDCLHTAAERIGDFDEESERKVKRIAMLIKLITTKDEETQPGMDFKSFEINFIKLRSHSRKKGYFVQVKMPNNSHNFYSMSTV